MGPNERLRRPRPSAALVRAPTQRVQRSRKQKAELNVLAPKLAKTGRSLLFALDHSPKLVRGPQWRTQGNSEQHPLRPAAQQLGRLAGALASAPRSRAHSSAPTGGAAAFWGRLALASKPLEPTTRIASRARQLAQPARPSARDARRKFRPPIERTPETTTPTHDASGNCAQESVVGQTWGPRESCANARPLEASRAQVQVM